MIEPPRRHQGIRPALALLATALALFSTAAFALTGVLQAKRLRLHLGSTVPGKEVEFRGVVITNDNSIQNVATHTPYRLEHEGDLLLVAVEKTGGDGDLDARIEDGEGWITATGQRIMLGRIEPKGPLFARGF